MASRFTASASLLLAWPVMAIASDGELAGAANDFLDTLDSEQRIAVARPFDSDERFDWHFIPKSNRKGLALKDMQAEQAQSVHKLLRAASGESGHTKITDVLRLEAILGNVEFAAGRKSALEDRDPEKYYVTVFGVPQPGGSWALSFEGHHVSLNFTVIDGVTIASSPAFFGANPHRVTGGENKGMRILGDEEDRARELLESFDDMQRALAIVATEAPGRISSGSKVSLEAESAQGIAASAMRAEQRQLLHALIEEYADNVANQAASERREQIRLAGDDIYFAWMGSDQLGKPHYYRIQSPTFLIEYDNSQNDGNHSHTVWRDFDGDFGRDVIADHRQAYVH